MHFKHLLFLLKYGSKMLSKNNLIKPCICTLKMPHNFNRIRALYIICLGSLQLNSLTPLTMMHVCIDNGIFYLRQVLLRTSI